MTKQNLIQAFYNNHKNLIDYINSLPDDKFMHSHNNKWTAGQQLVHMYLCLKPICQALASKEFIIQKFGRIDRIIMEYDEVIKVYKTALDKGGKSPDRFVPETTSLESREKVSEDLTELIKKILQQLESYTEEELDSLVLPHPLLGNLTIRELFYLMTYHATHHHRQTERNLSG